MSKTVTIATKVTQETAMALKSLADKCGVSTYELVAVAIIAMLRVKGSKKIALSPVVKESLHIYEQMHGPLSQARINDIHDKQLRIRDAIYIVEQKGKKDPTLMYMPGVLLNKVTDVSINFEQIVSMVMRIAYPNIHKLLKEIAVENNLPSVMAAICHLIHENHDELMTQQIEELFSDNSRAENNRDVNQQPYKRKNNKSINQPTLFDNEQGQELPQTDRQPPMAEARFEDEEGI